MNDEAEIAARIYDAIKKYIDGINEDLKKAKLDISSFQKETQKKNDKLKEEIDRSKQDVISTLAVFVGLFTFISIEFQLIAKIESLKHLISLTFILAGLLAGFVNMMYLIAKNQKSYAFTSMKKDFRFLLLSGVSALFLIIGLTIFAYGEISGVNSLQNNEDKRTLILNNEVFVKEEATNSAEKDF